DGQSIAFSSDRGGTSDLYIIDLDGNGRRGTELTGGAFDPSWAPDGRSLTFAGLQSLSFRISRQPLRDEGQRIALDPAADRDSAGSGIGAWNWTDLDAPVVAEAGVQPYSSWEKMSLDFAAADALYA